MTRKGAGHKVQGLGVDAANVKWGTDVDLPPWETRIYALAWIGAVFYCIYSVYEASNDFINALNDYFLIPGWRILGRRKDTSNFEWDFWSGWFLETWPWFAGHFIVSFVSRKLTNNLRDIMFILHTNLTLIFLLGIEPLFLVWGHIGLMYMVTYIRSKVAVWGISILLLSTLNIDMTVNLLKQVVGVDPFEKKFYLLLFVLAMTNIRYTSAALDITDLRNSSHVHTRGDSLNNQTKRNQGMKSRANYDSYSQVQNKEMRNQSRNRTSANFTKTGVLDMLVYVFYLPLYFTGPVMTYDVFHSQFHCSPPHPQPLLPKIISFLFASARVIFWTLVLELSLYIFYFNCIQLDSNLLQKIPLWALAGVGYSHGQFFMMKYVVFFGGPSVLARVDRLETPLGPKCIGRIYLYSDMWKYFDRGLYAFLKKYIYIPLGGSQYGVIRQMLASVACFAFVYYWHGGEDYLLVWTALNLLGITLETLAGKAFGQPEVQHWIQGWLSATNIRRLSALLSVPLLAMSCIAIFCFFGGKKVGSIFFYRLLIEGFPQSTVLVVIFLYCCIQTSIEIRHWEKRKEHMD